MVLDKRNVSSVDALGFNIKTKILKRQKIVSTFSWKKDVIAGKSILIKFSILNSFFLYHKEVREKMIIVLV